MFGSDLPVQKNRVHFHDFFMLLHKILTQYMLVSRRHGDDENTANNSTVEVSPWNNEWWELAKMAYILFHLWNITLPWVNPRPQFFVVVVGLVEEDIQI